MSQPQIEERPPERDGDIQAWARAIVAIATRIARSQTMLQSKEPPPQKKKAA